MHKRSPYDGTGAILATVGTGKKLAGVVEKEHLPGVWLQRRAGLASDPIRHTCPGRDVRLVRGVHDYRRAQHQPFAPRRFG